MTEAGKQHRTRPRAVYRCGFVGISRQLVAKAARNAITGWIAGRVPACNPRLPPLGLEPCNSTMTSGFDKVVRTALPLVVSAYLSIRRLIQRCSRYKLRGGNTLHAFRKRFPRAGSSANAALSAGGARVYLPYVPLSSCPWYLCGVASTGVRAQGNEAFSDGETIANGVTPRNGRKQNSKRASSSKEAN